MKLLGKNLFGQTYSLPAYTDMTALMRECRQQAVVAVALSDLCIPDDPTFTRTVYQAVLHNNVVFSEHTLLHERLTENGIPYVILKGASSAHYYPQPMLRAMGDVDFLVKQADMDRVCALLQADGYVMQGEEHPMHHVFVKEDTHLEAHFTFAANVNPEIDRLVGEYMASVIDQAELVSARHCTCMLPDKFHHGLILLLHMQRHMLTEGLGLRHLCDWAVFVHAFTDHEFSDLFREPLKKIGLWKYARIVSLSAHIGLGLPYADFMGGDYDLAEKLLQDILCSGNFGRRDKGRINERFFISRKSDTGKEQNRIETFRYQINRSIIAHWPGAEKNAALRLFGWLYFPLRRVFLRLTKKRSSLKLVKRYKKSAVRREIYAELHLFETE